MESDECICQSYFIRQLEVFAQSLSQTLIGISNNQNLPMNDSGIYPQGSNQSNSNILNQSGFMSRIDLNSTAYSLILLAIVFFLLSTIRGGNSKKKESNRKKIK